MAVLKVDKYKARTAEEEYGYWSNLLHNKIDEKLPWDMHRNELRALDMYYRKIRRKIRESLDMMKQEAHN